MAFEGSQMQDVLQHGYRFALALTHNRGEAEELVQEIALRVLRSDRQVNRFGFLRAVKNHYIDGLRRSRARPEAIPVDEHDVGSAPDNADPDWDAPLELTNGVLSRALGAIRPEERCVIFLWAVEELSAQQIAELMEWPRSTVLSLLQRGRAKLRRMLEHDSGE